jgi:TonB family protein
MTLLEGRQRGSRKTISFVASVGLHGAVLTWMVLGPPLPGSEPPAKSVFDREFSRDNKKIIWYTMKAKLPDVSPTDAAEDPRPPRAKVLSKQTIVSGPKDEDDATQRIWMPAPEVQLPKPLPLPNVVAVAPPKVFKPFVPPPEAEPKPKPAPALPDAPKVAAAAPAAKPLQVATPVVKPTPLAFTPPPEVRMQRQAAILLPEAPATETVVEPNALPFERGGAMPQRRAFVAPTGGAKQRSDAPIAVPSAPEVAAAAAAIPGVKLPKTFVPPPSKPVPAGGGAPGIRDDAPMVSGTSGTPNQASLAIVGLNPSNATELPAPPGSRSAGFSAGPEKRTAGGAGSAGGAALLGVPGLLVRGGANDASPTRVSAVGLAPTSRENLALAARTLPPGPPPPPPETVSKTGALRVTESPDPRLSGRVVYTVAIQMPNVTSFSGSWLVWFAEHEVAAGSGPVDMKAPVPLHKVDPKYIAAAVAERVEGKVRLYGVIRKDGHVDSIALIQHVDVRLDQSAAGALAQWVFEPALRNGRPVDVDAVFEIPFHLAPRTTK